MEPESEHLDSGVAVMLACPGEVFYNLSVMVPGNGLTEPDWETLVNAVENGRCTPFLGAGASSPPLPLGRGFAILLLQKWKAKAKNNSYAALAGPCGEDLKDVAQFLAVTHDAKYMKSLIAECIQEMGLPDFSCPIEPHRYLAGLELPLYLTSNYDSFMVQALIHARKSPWQEFARWPRHLLARVRSKFDDSKFAPTQDKPVVFHFHGCAENEDGTQAIVASEDDYLDFLVNVSKEPEGARPRAIIPLRIRSRIRETTILFLGYGLRDVNLLFLLRLIHEGMDPSQQPKSLAVQLPPEDEKCRRHLKEYFDKMNIMVFWGTIEAFIKQLDERRQRHGLTCDT